MQLELRTLVIALTIFGALGCGSVARTAEVTIPEHSATTPVPRHERWVAFHERLKKISARRGPYDMVFLGDSITYEWSTKGAEVWERYYGDRRALNLGVGGDRTEHVLWRLDHGALDGLSPRLVVLLIGTNNMVQKDDPPHTSQELADGVAAIVQRLRTKLPQAKILVLGTFPRGRGPKHRLRPKIAAANELMRPLADNPAVSFLDISAAFIEPDGKISPELMGDFLHLTAAGYEIWAEEIEEMVAELLGEED